MNWKNRMLGAAAISVAAVIGTATSAFAEGPHYAQSQGFKGGDGGYCAYNWVQGDTTGYPGQHGNHVFVSGIVFSSAALKTPGCNPHVETAYEHAGAQNFIWGKLLTNGSWETGVLASTYTVVDYTDMWITDVNGTTVPGTFMRVSPTGKVLLN